MYDVSTYGAVADGTGDNTAAFAAAINAASSAGGGVVTVSPGKYNFTGVLSLPASVSLMGTAPGPIDNINGVNGAAIYVSTPTSNPSAFISTHGSTVVSDLSFYYPNQVTSGTPLVYPPVIQSSSPGNTFRNLYMQNVYRGIYLSTAAGAPNAGRDLIENVHMGVFGEAGIVVDHTLDTSRLHNVHIWPFYEPHNDLRTYASTHTYGIIMRHAEAMQLSNVSVFGTQGGIFFQASPDDGKCSYGQISNLYCDTTLQGAIVATGTAFPQGWIVNNLFIATPTSGSMSGINLSPGGFHTAGAQPTFNIVGGSLYGGRPANNWVTKGSSMDVCHLTAVLEYPTYIPSQT